MSLASAGRVYSVESCYLGDSYVLPATAPDYPGMELLGWSYVPVAYTDERPAFLKPGTELPITGDLLLHAVYGQIDGNLEDSFALVTSTRADWTGDWVITYGKNAPSFVLAGVHNTIYEHASSGGAVSFADSGMQAGAEYLAGVDQRYVFRMEKADGKYTLRSLSTGDYVYVYNGTAAAYLASQSTG